MNNFENKVQTIKTLDNKSMVAISWLSVIISLYILTAQIYDFTISTKAIYVAAVFMTLFYVSRLLLSFSINIVSKNARSNASNIKAIDEIKKISRAGIISSLLLGVLVGNMAVTHLSTEKAALNASIQNEINKELRKEIEKLKNAKCVK